jgi:hypothetical protein
MSSSRSRISKWNSSRMWYFMNKIRDVRPKLGRCGITSLRRCFSSHVQGEILILQNFLDWVLENGSDELTFDIKSLLLCVAWTCYGTKHCPSNVLCWCGWFQSTRWINLSPSTPRQRRLFIRNAWLGSTNVCLCAIWH